MPFGITERKPSRDEVKFFRKQYRIRSKNPDFDHHDFFYDMALTTGFQVLCGGVRDSIRSVAKSEFSKKRNKFIKPVDFAKVIPYKEGSKLAEWENPFGFFPEIQKVISSKKNIKIWRFAFLEKITKILSL